MVQYIAILDEDRRSIASQMEERFYHNAGNIAPIEPKPVPEGNKAPAAPALDANALASLLTSNPELLAQVLKSIQLANS